MSATKTPAGQHVLGRDRKRHYQFAAPRKGLLLPSEAIEAHLSDRFPVSWKYVIRKSWYWILAFIPTAVGYLFLLSWEQAGNPTGQSAELMMLMAEKKSVLLVGVTFVLFFRFGYSILYRMTLRYSIAHNRLRVRRGVILREEASLPLLPLTELFLKPTWPDLVLGLRNLYISTPLERVARFANIEGLRTEDARRLKSFIETSLSQFARSTDISVKSGAVPGNMNKPEVSYLSDTETS